MTIEEAITYFKHSLKMCQCETKAKQRQAFELAIEALGYRELRKLKYKMALLLCCPTCEEPIQITSRFCPNCGQKIDWGLTNEKG